MPFQIIFLGVFAVVVFTALTLLFLPLALRPGKEAQRAIEVALRPARKNTLLARKDRFLRELLLIVAKVRARLHLVRSEKSARRLAMAGYWNASAADFYFAAQILAPVSLAWIGSLIQSSRLFWMCAFASVGVISPSLWLTHAIRKRRDSIRRGLPDAIDLLVICVDAGLGLDQAVIRTSDELVHSHPDLHDELHRVHLEQRAGRPRLETWQNLAERTTLPELASFVSLLVQAERFGTQVTKALSVFADDIRQKQRQRAEEGAAELKVKILFPLVLFIFPCLLVSILGPAVLKITQDLQELMK